MANGLNFDAKDRIISDVLFSTEKFQIPRYQRAYTWTEDQISEFWNDLIGSKEAYFIGSLIFNYEPYKTTGYIDIIDGQQRLLTITIFIAVLRDIAKGLDTETAERYQRQDISFEDRYGHESYRILPGESTKEFFEEAIQKKDTDHKNIDITTLSKESLRIKKAYDFLYEKVQDEINKYSDKERKIENLNSLRDKVANLIVIKIQIDNEEEAYEIFEATNARGVDLSIADLLKNAIFKRIQVDSHRDSAKDIWMKIVNDIDETGIEMKKFLRYFWISKHSFVSEKKLFKAVKKEITDWKLLLEHLSVDSNLFSNLLVGNEDEFIDFKHGNKIFKSIFSLRLMNVSQCYVLFLSILRNYEKLGSDPTRIFQLIEKFTFQYSVVCKLPANKVERVYSKCAIEIEEAINNGTAKKISGMVQSAFSRLEKELKDLKPSYEIFKEGFMSLSYKDTEGVRKMIKYILGEINDHFAQSDEYKIDYNNVNIEHILPRNPDEKWNLTKRDIKEYVNKLGNLTLLSKKLNSNVQNKIVEEKIDEYRKSALPLTVKIIKELEDLSFKWDQDEINTRHENLSKIAYSNIWNY